MSRAAQKIVFVCSSLIDGNLINKIIEAKTLNEASLLFYGDYKVEPQQILGPFAKKKIKPIDSSNIPLIFSADTKRAYYNDWLVNAFILKEPKNYSYLIFVKRLDDSNKSPPKGTIIIPNSELRFIDE